MNDTPGRRGFCFRENDSTDMRHIWQGQAGKRRGMGGWRVEGMTDRQDRTWTEWRNTAKT